MTKYKTQLTIFGYSHSARRKMRKQLELLQAVVLQVLQPVEAAVRIFNRTIHSYFHHWSWPSLYLDTGFGLGFGFGGGTSGTFGFSSSGNTTSNTSSLKDNSFVSKNEGPFGAPNQSRKWVSLHQTVVIPEQIHIWQFYQIINFSSPVSLAVIQLRQEVVQDSQQHHFLNHQLQIYLQQINQVVEVREINWQLFFFNFIILRFDLLAIIIIILIIIFRFTEWSLVGWRQ